MFSNDMFVGNSTVQARFGTVLPQCLSDVFWISTVQHGACTVFFYKYVIWHTKFFGGEA